MSAANPVSAPITQDVMTIPRKLPDGPLNLVGLTRDAMRDALVAHGTPEKQAKMRVEQIWQWIYQWGVRDFDAMTNLSKTYRAELADQFVIEIPEVVSKQVSTDGTRKWLVRIAGGAAPAAWSNFLGAVSGALLWPLTSIILQWPQRPPPSPGER